jgi:hypothetical protein
VYFNAFHGPTGTKKGEKREKYLFSSRQITVRLLLFFGPTRSVVSCIWDTIGLKGWWVDEYIELQDTQRHGYTKRRYIKGSEEFEHYKHFFMINRFIVPEYVPVDIAVGQPTRLYESTTIKADQMAKDTPSAIPFR